MREPKRTHELAQLLLLAGGQVRSLAAHISVPIFVSTMKIFFQTHLPFIVFSVLSSQASPTEQLYERGIGYREVANELVNASIDPNRLSSNDM